MDERKLLIVMSEIEKTDGAVDRDLLPAKFPDTPPEEIFETIEELQLAGELLEPFPHFYRLMHEQSSGEVKWETKIPTSKGAKGPYEFTTNMDVSIREIVKQIRDSGTYCMVVDNYKYWLMRGGLARRKVNGGPT